MECPYCSADLGSGVAQVGRHSKAQKRSQEQHGRWFAMVAIVYEQWPETFAEFQPTSVTHLRKWLTAKAGYVDRIYIEPPTELISDDPMSQRLAWSWMLGVMKDIRRLHDYSWINRHRRGFQIVIPKSVSFEKMTQYDFNNLSARTDTELERVGFDVRVLFHEADKRTPYGKAARVHKGDEEKSVC